MTNPENKTYTLIGADGEPYQNLTKGTLGEHHADKIYGNPGLQRRGMLDCQRALR